MEAIILLIFILGYIAITLEHQIKLDKTVPALIMASLCWGIIAISHMEVFEIKNGLVSITQTLLNDTSLVEELSKSGLLSPEEIESEIRTESILHSISHHISAISEILIFLLGAMTIVEIIDLHKGFSIIKKFIKTRSKKKLLWIFVTLAFILSAIIDNLTATIVLITILRKLIPDKKERIWFVGIVVIAANAGGAWSPVGDVTTTMLWIAKKVTTLKLIEYVLIPSIVCMVIPTLIIQNKKIFQGSIKVDKFDRNETYPYSALILYVGIGMIIFVPIFKSITHLPPYVGMMLALGIVWLVAEIATLGNFKRGMQLLNELNPKEKYQKKKEFLEDLKGTSAHNALSRIELSSILFFLGILLAVAALESLGILFNFATVLENNFSEEVTVILLGIGSSIIDNVPLVAASIGMFHQAVDAEVWHFIAFSAGTGGSMLIIGSAAGVAAMGMEKISFGWYFKNFTLLAFIGFICGCSCFLLFKYFGLY